MKHFQNILSILNTTNVQIQTKPISNAILEF